MNQFVLLAMLELGNPEAPKSAPQATAAAPNAAKTAPATQSAKSEALTVGTPVTSTNQVALSELIAKAESLSGKTVVLTGKVAAACQKKGCWMELTGDKASERIRVTFKDYAFFVPKDSAGKIAKIQGLPKVVELDQATAEHYQSEGASVAKGPDGKYREISVVATGVELTPAPAK